MVEKPEPPRLAPLDALRGLAALAVSAFSHYENFGGDRDEYPFMHFTAGKWLYGHSWLFVDLFFLVSGVVMTHRYLEPLREARTDAKGFFWLRFSRLYPLHLATLLVCAAVQWTLMAQDKSPVIYPADHDLYHFVLHLTYLHSGWFDLKWAYNMPSWSVCSEVFVYVVFFLLATRCRGWYGFACAVAILVGLTGQTAPLPRPLPVLNEFMGRGLTGFFLGSLLVFLMNYTDRVGKSGLLGLACLVALGLAAVFAYVFGYDDGIGGLPIHSVLTVFPLAVVASLKVKPLARLLSLRPLTFLGDISYSVYLVHVPMQMVALAYIHAKDIELQTAHRSVFYTYIVSVLVVATLTYYGIERPAQRWLRRRLLTA